MTPSEKFQKGPFRVSQPVLADGAEGIFEGYGPMEDDCTVLFPAQEGRCSRKIGRAHV